jgi:chromosomal replication initiation ATPase DnaA
MIAARILAAVAAHFGLSMADLSGRSRLHHIVLARQAAAWALRRATPLSLSAIGQLLGGRDHKTILHAIAQTESRMAADAMLRAQLHAIVAPPSKPSRPRDMAMRWWVVQGRSTWEVLSA